LDTLSVRNIHKHYDGELLLNGLSLEVHSGEILCLLGRSGSGKSTLLRIIAGLELAEKGEVLWNGDNIAATPTHLRKFGLMFQDYALFPHRNVAENVAFGLEMMRLPKPKTNKMVKEALERVNMEAFAQRSVAELSGGEQQRVALARALAAQPRLLMLDEPLAALDRSLRLELQQELSIQLHQAGIPVIYVTHDQEEAVILGDRLAILHDGEIVQNDTPQHVYAAPANRWVAEFLGMKNFVKGKVSSTNPLMVSTSLGVFEVYQSQKGTIKIGDEVTLTFSSENAKINYSAASMNSIRGTVTACNFRQSGFLVTVVTGQETPMELVFQQEMAVRSPITLEFSPSSIILLYN
jgi:ABC-type Fe3+/spermidine/putrescine transport system ATPase subunit